MPIDFVIADAAKIAIIAIESARPTAVTTTKAAAITTVVIVATVIGINLKGALSFAAR